MWCPQCLSSVDAMPTMSRTGNGSISHAFLARFEWSYDTFICLHCVVADIFVVVADIFVVVADIFVVVADIFVVVAGRVDVITLEGRKTQRVIRDDVTLLWLYGRMLVFNMLWRSRRVIEIQENTHVFVRWQITWCHTHTHTCTSNRENHAKSAEYNDIYTSLRHVSKKVYRADRMMENGSAACVP